MVRIALAFALLLGCKTDAEVPATPQLPPPVAEQPGAACPTDPVSSTMAPGTAQRHREVKTWLGDGASAAILAAAVIPELNAGFSEIPGAWRDPGAREVGLPETVAAGIEERMRYLGDMVARGAFVEGEAGSIASARSVVARASAVDHQRVVVAEAALHCIPLSSGLYKEPVDPAFDRNACASLHPGERVRVLRRGAQGEWLHVHAGHTVGWLYNAAVTPRLSREDLDRWTSSPQLVPMRDDVATADGFALRLGVSVPLVRRTDEGYVVLAPDPEGLHETSIAAGAPVAEAHPPLRRDLLLQAAFSELGRPYGWGGRAGERDCSRFLRDLFATFGIQLARHSGVQAKLGTRSIDVSEASEARKRELLATWGQRGVVLLYMKGHIMLYLGRDGEHDYAISSVSEYLEPCEGGADTVRKLDRVAVTTLELGRGTERTAFIERISTLVVFDALDAGA